MTLNGHNSHKSINVYDSYIYDVVAV